jgi:hypothetical protein
MFTPDLGKPATDKAHLPAGSDVNHYRTKTSKGEKRKKAVRTWSLPIAKGLGGVGVMQ